MISKIPEQLFMRRILSAITLFFHTPVDPLHLPCNLQTRFRAVLPLRSSLSKATSPNTLSPNRSTIHPMMAVAAQARIAQHSFESLVTFHKRGRKDPRPEQKSESSVSDACCMQGDEGGDVPALAYESNKL